MHEDTSLLNGFNTATADQLKNPSLAPETLLDIPTDNALVSLLAAVLMIVMQLVPGQSWLYPYG